jgi:UDPglucose 6-dehydrogenase
LEAPLLDAIADVNGKQHLKAVGTARGLLGSLRGKRVAVLGLAFKPETNDGREAPSPKMISSLVEEGAEVRVHDPVAISNAKRILDDGVQYHDDIHDCISGTECAIIATEWGEYRVLTPQILTQLVRIPVAVDGRRIYDTREFHRKSLFRAVDLEPLSDLEDDHRIFVLHQPSHKQHIDIPLNTGSRSVQIVVHPVADDPRLQA